MTCRHTNKSLCKYLNHAEFIYCFKDARIFASSSCQFLTLFLQWVRDAGGPPPVRAKAPASAARQHDGGGYRAVSPSEFEKETMAHLRTFDHGVGRRHPAARGAGGAIRNGGALAARVDRCLLGSRQENSRDGLSRFGCGHGGGHSRSADLLLRCCETKR